MITQFDVKQQNLAQYAVTGGTFFNGLDSPPPPRGWTREHCRSDLYAYRTVDVQQQSVAHTLRCDSQWIIKLINQPINQSIFIYLFIYLFVYLFIYLFVCLFVFSFFFVFSFVCWFVFSFVRSFVLPSFIYLFIYLFI